MDQFKKLKFVSLCIEDLYVMIEEGEKLIKRLFDIPKERDHLSIMKLFERY